MLSIPNCYLSNNDLSSSGLKQKSRKICLCRNYKLTLHKNKKEVIMALEIKAIPTLYGEAAERFLKLAEATPEERSKRKKIKIDRDLVDKVLRKAKMV